MMAWRRSREFNSEYETSVKLYSQLGKQIEQFSSLNVSDKLRAICRRFPVEGSQDHIVILRKIEEAANLYRRAHDEAERYVRKARNFAQENIFVANNAIEGKRFYNPEVVLKKFEKTAENLQTSFGSVIEQHNKVQDSIVDASQKVWTVQRRTRGSVSEAGEDMICNTPVVGVLAAPPIMAANWSQAFDNPVGKVVAGTAGFVAGLLRGLLSTASLGIPMAVAASRKQQHEELQKEYQAIQAALQHVDTIVANHKSLLIDIRAHLDGLSVKYKSIRDDLKDEDLLMCSLDLLINASKHVTESCDKYLSYRP